MMKGLVFLLFIVVAAFILGLCLYSLYRAVVRENDLDAAELRDAARACEEQADRLEKAAKK